MPIIGTCIKDGCNHPIPMFAETEDGRVAYVPHTCENCGTKMWTQVSRTEPMSWTEEEFFKHYKVDKVSKTIEAIV